MANPTPLTHTTVQGRKTLAIARTAVAFAIGLADTELSTGQKTQVEIALNDEINDWRLLVPSLKGLGEVEKTVTVAADDDTALELPADFEEFVGGHIWKLDENGYPAERIEVVERAEVMDSYIQVRTNGITIPVQSSDTNTVYDLEDRTVAYLYGLGPNKRRILYFHAPQLMATQFKILYRGQVEKLVNDGDVIEAPPACHDGIVFGAAERYCQLAGMVEKAMALGALKNRKIALLKGVQAREVHRPMRVLSFEDVGGYEGFKPSGPPPAQGGI